MARDDEDDVSYSKHPALRNFNRTGFMIKHTLKTALKWGAIGLVAGAGAMLAGALAGIWTAGGATIGIGYILSKIPVVGDFLKEAASGVGGDILTAGTYVLGGAGIIGGVAGLVVGMSNASAAADAEEDRLVAKFEQAQARKDRLAALERRRDQQAMAMERQASMQAPGVQIPYGRPRGGPGQGGPAYT